MIILKEKLGTSFEFGSPSPNPPVELEIYYSSRESKNLRTADEAYYWCEKLPVKQFCQALVPNPQTLPQPSPNNFRNPNNPKGTVADTKIETLAPTP